LHGKVEVAVRAQSKVDIVHIVITGSA
jgi:hypothetical protein